MNRPLVLGVLAAVLHVATTGPARAGFVNGGFESPDVPVNNFAFLDQSLVPGWQTTAARLTRLGGNPVLRKQPDGAAFRTDGGNLILDCHFGVIADPAQVEQDLSRTIGVVETGLFIGMATTALVATQAGIVRLDR